MKELIDWLTKGSWKTTSAGLIAIVGGVVRLIFALKAGALSEEAIMTTITTIFTGLGLLVARDNDKSSESVGADEQTKVTQNFTNGTGLWLLLGALAFGFTTPLLTGCSTPQQRIAFNSLATVQTVTVAAYDGYAAGVVRGTIPPDDLPRVSQRFDQFQAAFTVALDAVQFNTNALAPESLQILSTDLLNLITQLSTKD